IYPDTVIAIVRDLATAESDVADPSATAPNFDSMPNNIARAVAGAPAIHQRDIGYLSSVGDDFYSGFCAVIRYARSEVHGIYLLVVGGIQDMSDSALQSVDGIQHCAADIAKEYTMVPRSGPRNLDSTISASLGYAASRAADS